MVSTPPTTHRPGNDRLTQVVVWPALLDPPACAQAIRMVQGHAPAQGRVGSGDAWRAEIRRSQIWFFRPEPATAFLFDLLAQAVQHLNEGYRFELTDFASGCQIARYQADDAGHYDWHMDLGTGEMSRRKLSVSVQLSAPADYDGGDLQFHVPGLDASRMRQQGTLVAFPSYLEHRVAPVTRGERWSLVAWIEGPPYR